MNQVVRGKIIEILESPINLDSKYNQLLALNTAIKRARDEDISRNVIIGIAKEAGEKIVNPLTETLNRFTRQFDRKPPEADKSIVMELKEMKDLFSSLLKDRPKMPTRINVSEIKEVVQGLERIENKISDQKLRVINPKELKVLGIDSVNEKLEKVIKGLDETLQVNILNKDPKKPISVRLSDGKKFYEAISAMFSLGESSTKIMKQVRDRLPSTLTSAGNLKIAIMEAGLNTVLLTGQKKVAVTGTAIRLPANTLKNGVIIGAHGDNVAAITVGGSGVSNTVDGTGNGRILEAGADTSFAVDNTNKLYINGDANDLISFAGS